MRIRRRLRRRSRPEGTGQDAVPAGVLHLPVDLRRDPRARHHPDLAEPLRRVGTPTLARTHEAPRSPRRSRRRASTTKRQARDAGRPPSCSARSASHVLAAVVGCSAGSRHLHACPTTRSSGTCERASGSSTTASRTTTCTRSPQPGTTWVAQSWLAEVDVRRAERSRRRVRHPAVRGLGRRVRVGVLAYRLALRPVPQARAARFGISAAALGGCSRCGRSGRSSSGCSSSSCCCGSSRYPTRRRPSSDVRDPGVMWLWANVHGSFALASRTSGCTSSVAGSTAAAVGGRGGSRAGARRLCRLVREPVRRGARAVPDRAALAWRDPVACHRVAVARLPLEVGIALAIWICVFIAAVARPAPGESSRPIVAVPMLLLALWALRNIAVAPLIGLPVVARSFAVAPMRPSGSARHSSRRRPPRSWPSA